MTCVALQAEQNLEFSVLKQPKPPPMLSDFGVPQQLGVMWRERNLV